MNQLGLIVIMATLVLVAACTVKDEQLARNTTTCYLNGETVQLSPKDCLSNNGEIAVFQEMLRIAEENASIAESHGLNNQVWIECEIAEEILCMKPNVCIRQGGQINPDIASTSNNIPSRASLETGTSVWAGSASPNVSFSSCVMIPSLDWS